jgi:hypothetical protein
LVGANRAETECCNPAGAGRRQAVGRSEIADLQIKQLRAVQTNDLAC